MPNDFENHMVKHDGVAIVVACPEVYGRRNGDGKPVQETQIERASLAFAAAATAVILDLVGVATLAEAYV